MSEESIEYPALYLKHGEDARLRAGHLWVFANEVDVARSPLTDFEPGQVCAIVDARGRALGVGYVNPHSLIAARLMSRGLDHAVDVSLLTHRVNVALALREALFDAPYYRLVYGESDRVPGLVVDRYGDLLVAQATSAGIERLKGEVMRALTKVLKPRVIVWKNDVAVRTLEGLPLYAEVAAGELADEEFTRESGLRFRIDPLHGQKTGWFLDQHANRDRVVPWLAGKDVLDLFCHVGGWGLRALAAGASHATCVDASAAAIDGTTANARANGLEAGLTTACADVFDWLRAAREQHQHFDAVIVDPPAFVKRRKDLAEGRQAYRRVNEMAMQVLARDGLLVSCSCSQHFPEAELMAAIQKAARHLDRHVQVLCRLQQGPDHPVHPAIPETAYLKGFVCRVLPA